MSPKETAAQRAERMRRAAVGRDEDRPAPRGTVRTRPVRTTVDLAPELHRALKRWTSDAAEEVGVPELPLAAVMRVLIRQLTEDGRLSAAVVSDLREELQ
jgi:hypothetical protein